MSKKKWVEDSLKIEQDECIIFPYYVNNGYPRIHVRLGKRQYDKIYANRFVCQMVYGPPPDENYQAAHSCGQSKCVNKRHIRWATRSENECDKVSHGTSNRGERQGQSMLTEQNVLDIVSLLNRGIDKKYLSIFFGVAEPTIANIKRGESWGWLTGIERK